MGHRCNYVIREGGHRTLYASNWGALTILRDFFWGLGPARAFLSQQAEVDEEDGWYDDVFGEGGAAVDLDGRVLVVSGGEIHGAARALGIEMMRAIWGRDGFSVRDEKSLVDVAAQVGVPAERIEAEHHARPALDPSSRESSGRDGWLDCLLVVDGTFRLCRTEQGVLEAGATIVPRLGELPNVSEARKLVAERPLAEWEKDRGDYDRELNAFMPVVVIDSARKVVRLSPWHLRRSTSRRHYETLWSGFRLEPLDELAGSAARKEAGLAVEPPEPEPTREALFAELESYVFEGDDGLERIVVDLERREREGSWVNPLAIRKPTNGRPEQSARDLFAWARLEVNTPDSVGRRPPTRAED